MGVMRRPWLAPPVRVFCLSLLACGAPSDAHEFLDAAQANHGGNAWVKSVPTTRGTTE